MEDEPMIAEFKGNFIRLIEYKIKTNEFHSDHLEGDAKIKWVVTRLFDRFIKIISATSVEEQGYYPVEFDFLDHNATALGLDLNKQGCFSDIKSPETMKGLELWAKNAKRIFFAKKGEEIETNMEEVEIVSKLPNGRLPSMDKQIIALLEVYMKREGLTPNFLKMDPIKNIVIRGMSFSFNKVLLDPGIKNSLVHSEERKLLSALSVESKHPESVLQKHVQNVVNWFRVGLSEVIVSVIEASPDEDTEEPTDVMGAGKSVVAKIGSDDLMEQRMIVAFKNLVINHLQKNFMNLVDLLSIGSHVYLWSSMSDAFCDLLFPEEIDSVREHPPELGFLEEYSQELGMDGIEDSFGTRDVKIKGWGLLKSLFDICIDLLLHKNNTKQKK